MPTNKIFQEFLEESGFVDKFISKPADGFDIIIPILNTDVFFERNLKSIYREFPVARLLVGDAGCTDNSLEILSQFPRVKIYDHSNFSCQGASIKALIDCVTTTFFAYCHADVYLPAGFYEEVSKHTLDNSWLESARNSLIVKEQYVDHRDVQRSYSGVQIGDSALLKKSVASLQDDFIQRNEDFIIRDLVEKHGGNYEKLSNLVHLHQMPFARGFGKPNYENKDWSERIYVMQIKGIIKYLDPPVDKQRWYLVDEVNRALIRLLSINRLNVPELRDWINNENPEWLTVISLPNKFQERIFRSELLRRMKLAARILRHGY